MMKKSILIISLFVFLSLPELSAQEVASIEHDTDFGHYNSLVQVDADTYVLAYEGDGNVRSTIATFTISADGTSIAEVASLVHDNTYGRHNSIVQVDADTYLLAYMGVGSDGFITTFTIPANGSSITEVQTLEHDIYSGHYNSLVQVDADTYVLAYQGRSQDGWISTFTVSADGTSITEVASLEHDTIKNTWNSIVQVDADTYALASNNSGGGTITTFTISADGTSITEVASLVHDNTAVEHNSLCQVDSDTYVLAYTQGVDGDGFIKTFTISSDGATIHNLFRWGYHYRSG